MISNAPAHEALVAEADFIAAQGIRATPTPADGATRTYLLRGMLVCGLCGRRRESAWTHGRPSYRCRHGHHSAKPAAIDRPKTLYVREDHAIAELRTLISHTCDVDANAVVAEFRSTGAVIVADIAGLWIVGRGRDLANRTVSTTR